MSSQLFFVFFSFSQIVLVDYGHHLALHMFRKWKMFLQHNIIYKKSIKKCIRKII